MVVLYRICYKLSLPDLVEMFLTRGFHFTYEAVREWEERFAPLVAEELRAKRKGEAGIFWYVDETHVSVEREWCYLYRAIDRDGNLVDVMLSKNRNMKAAKKFFNRHWMLSVLLLTELLLMGMIAIHAQFVKPWAKMLSIEPIHISITDWNKIIVASNNAFIPCLDSETSIQHLDFVLHLKKYDNSSTFVAK